MRISNPFDGNAFNFINFHTASNSKYLQDTCILEVGCFRNPVDTMQNIEFITETIVAAHDPNYIEVRCITKEIIPKLWPFGSKKVKVSYHIECYNDGIGDANSVSFAFTLPDIANPSKVWINSWKCGNTNGCNRNTGPNPLIWNQTGQAIIINFTNGKLKGISSPFSDRQAYVDFCVEINTTDLESVLNWDTNLQITNASTKFDTTSYPIIRFIDPKKGNINQNDRTTNKSSCFCDCKSKKNPLLKEIL
ncbi:MAG: hypothetical protein IPH98_11160 [Saprospiraceae bacterium]|nr:hypothetical protein [Candidatus Defluviibacterium haderslevense]